MADDGQYQTQEIDPDAPTDSSDGGDDGGNFLTHRAGPLPVWGWGAVLIGGVLIWMYLKHRNAANAAANPPGGSLATSGAPLPTGQDTSPQSTTPVNQSWAQQAYDALVNTLGYDSTSVSQALQDYAAGNTLNPTEFGIIEAAINSIGAPPIPAKSGGGYGTPTATPPPPPRADVISNYNVIGDIIAHLQPPSGGDVYITNEGFVYALNGAKYFGGTNGGGLGYGANASHITAAAINPSDGGYTLYSANGGQYAFGPGTTPPNPNAPALGAPMWAPAGASAANNWR